MAKHPPDWYSCFTCKKLFPLLDGIEARCITCNTSNGEIISAERAQQGFDAGTYYNIDLRTGGRAKPKRRR